MNVLVTGASGFIGREIVSALALNNHRVIALSRAEKKTGDDSPNVSFRRGDITVAESLKELEKIENLDAVIHSAGLAHQFGETSKEEFDAVNVKGTENVLNLAVNLRVKHFILIGSTAIYGIRENLSKTAAIDEDTEPNPPTLYAQSKLAGELICREICEANRMPLTIFRLAPVIGEANVGNVARLIEAIDRRRFVWVGDGRNLKSLIDKRDVARACVRLIENKRSGTEIFNLAAAPVKMQDFVDEIAARLGAKILPVRIPANLVRVFFRANARTLNVGKINKISETVEKWLADDVYAAEKIAESYQFEPATTILEAVKRQIDFYQQS